jgi:hypothetical protein
MEEWLWKLVADQVAYIDDLEWYLDTLYNGVMSVQDSMDDLRVQFGEKGFRELKY